MNKYLFVNLVTMLSMSAMQQLGKLVPGRAGNPAEGKAEINLDAAQATIDTLDMLSAKTNGNLDKDEARLMKDTLSMLKMNFVETRNEEEIRGQRSEVRGQRPGATETQKTEPQRSEASDQKSAKAEDQQKSADKQEDSKARETADDRTETKDTKFHKSYGE